MSEEPETFNERKSPELQRELESVYLVPAKKDWLNRLLRAIGRYFGLE